MTLQQWLVAGIFLATFIGLIRFQRAPERVFAVTTLGCLAIGLVDIDTVLQNSINIGLVTLMLLVVVSFAFERTSMLRVISNKLISGAPLSAKFKLLVATCLSSAMMNNTAVVASLLSPINNNGKINAGKLLIPVSFAAIFGGTLTLVGTSTNLIVNSMLIEQTGQSLGFFAFTSIGAVVCIVGILWLLLTSERLPNINNTAQENAHYLVEAKVAADSSLIGHSVEDNGLRNLDSLFLVEIVRNGRLITPVEPDHIILPNDKLIFSGDVSKVKVFNQFDGLTLFAEQDGLLRENLTEVLVKPDASIVGKTLKASGFRARFDAAVVAIRREGTSLSGKLGEIVIEPGDFLMLAVGNDFIHRNNLSKNFYLISGHQPDNMLHGWRDQLTVFGFLAAITTSVFTSISLLQCLIFYIAALLATNCLNLNEIKRRFPIEIWLVVLGALTLADSFEQSGLARELANYIDVLLSGQSPYIALIGVYLLTLVITELITNNAAAALMFPVAFSVATGLGVNPITFVMAIAFAASGSFISPFGYQTNIMVYNAANYRLIDFVKFGIPVSMLYSAVVLILLPIIFPF